MVYSNSVLPHLNQPSDFMDNANLQKQNIKHTHPMKPFTCLPVNYKRFFIEQ